MCIGVPMQVVNAGETSAWCEGRGQRQQLDMLLVGEQAPGTWILAFRGSAVRVMTAGEAAQTNDALDALEAVLAGAANFDVYFADLVDRDHATAEGTEGSHR